MLAKGALDDYGNSGLATVRQILDHIFPQNGVIGKECHLIYCLIGLRFWTSEKGPNR